MNPSTMRKPLELIQTEWDRVFELLIFASLHTCTKTVTVSIKYMSIKRFVDHIFKSGEIHTAMIHAKKAQFSVLLTRVSQT